MKIAILAPEFIPAWGGVGIYAVELVKGLAKEPGMEIYVLMPDRGRSVKDVMKDLGNPKNVHVHYVSKAKDTFVYNHYFQLGVKKHFKELHSRYHFDLVHSMNLVHMPDIYLDFNKMGIPHVCTVHTTIQTQMEGIHKSGESFFKLSFVEKCSFALYPYISFMQKRYLKKYTHLISVSHMIEKKLRALGYDKEIVVIHNGIGQEKFSKPKRIEYKLPKKKNILYVGRLLKQKGIEVFVQLMSELKDEDYHFVICGHGGENEFQELLKKYDIPKKRYTFLGYIPNDKLNQIYSQAYALVLPSYFENLPITLLEAMAQDVPCIASNVGGVGEIIEDGKTGYLVKAGSIQQIKKRIPQLENANTRKRIIRAAHDDVTKKFSAEALTTKTIITYKHICTTTS